MSIDINLEIVHFSYLYSCDNWRDLFNCCSRSSTRRAPSVSGWTSPFFIAADSKFIFVFSLYSSSLNVCEIKKLWKNYTNRNSGDNLYTAQAYDSHIYPDQTLQWTFNIYQHSTAIIETIDFFLQIYNIVSLMENISSALFWKFNKTKKNQQILLTFISLFISSTWIEFGSWLTIGLFFMLRACKAYSHNQLLQNGYIIIIWFFKLFQ